MRFQPLRTFASRLLPIAIAGALYAPASYAQSLCAAPSLDSQLNIHIPCYRMGDQVMNVTLNFTALDNDQYRWEIGDLTENTCQPSVAACRSHFIQNASGLALKVSGLNVFGVKHDTQLTTVLDGEHPDGGYFVSPSLNALAAVSEGVIDVNQPLATVSFAGGKVLNLDVGVGSGAFHFPSDPANILYTVTDRGPNIPCGDSGDLLDVTDFCMNNGEADSSAKIFPVPEFSPSIYQFQLNPNGSPAYTVLNVIPLRNSAGETISGLSNPLTVTDTENAYDPEGGMRTLDPAGVDTEALVKLSNGSFWLADEYGGSLIHVAADGVIINRVVPAGMEADLAEAGYPVTGGLPEVIKMRKLNRGIESIAVSPDEQYLYFIMQSPLANPNSAAYSGSRTARLFKAALNDDGSFGEVVGEYAYVLDRPETFLADNGTKQSDIKLSEMVALDQDRVLVLERNSKHTKLYRIPNLAAEQNFIGSTWDDLATSPSLEQTSDLAAAGVQPVTKELAFDSYRDMPELAEKIEGVALLDDEYVALINDDDFGIAGETTQITVAKLAEQLNVGGAKAELKLTQLGRYDTGLFDESAAEIVAYDADTQRLFVVNAHAAAVDVLDVSTPSNLNKVATIDASSLGAGANSVAVSNGLIAIAIENTDKQANGLVAFYNTSDLSLVKTVTVGALPDMVTFTPDGNYVLVANEGEPNSDYTVDPEGSVAIISVAGGVIADEAVIAGFGAFNEQVDSLRASGVGIYGPNATVAQDLEPEYITVSPDSSTAWVSLQEANALAVVDINAGAISAVLPLGFKNHLVRGNELDASNKDDRINLQNWPVLGMYQPDSIASYEANGAVWIVTANEGDSRDYDGYSEEARVADVTLNPEIFTDAATLQAEENLGRLKITTSRGDEDGDGVYDTLYSYGARSFSIWSSAGELVYDSGNEFALITANAVGDKFNSDSDDEFDSRSDDKGSEPEALAVGEIDGKMYAFIGLERVGGIIVYNISNPQQPYFVTYVTNRDFSVTPAEGVDAGDIAPEGMKFIDAAHSPTGLPLLAVSNEVSGTTTVYQLEMK